VGGWAGKNGAEIEAEFPGGRQAWANAPAGMRLPDGETLLESQAQMSDVRRLAEVGSLRSWRTDPA